MIRVGIIGTGRIGQVHMRSIATGVPDAKVVAVADPYVSDAAKALAQSFGIENIYTDYKKIIDDPAIDAVLICCPTPQHAPISLEAIAAGKHIFCEKPVDMTVEKIEEVKAALENAPKKVKFQVGFNRRFDHNYRAIREAVQSGKIGDVQFVRICSRDPAPPSPEYVAVSGGLFLDMMIHDLDMVRYLSGQDIVELYAQGACLVDPAIGKAGDIDTATITCKLANGALATIDGSRQAVYGYDQRGEVFGSKGMIRSENDTTTTNVLSTVDGVVSDKPLWFFLERYMGSYQEEIRQFIASIVNDTPTVAGIDDGLLSVKLAKACARSLAENRPIPASEF